MYSDNLTLIRTHSTPSLRTLEQLIGKEYCWAKYPSQLATPGSSGMTKHMFLDISGSYLTFFLSFVAVEIILFYLQSGVYSSLNVFAEAICCLFKTY